jgi:hypothetical protein
MAIFDLFNVSFLFSIGIIIILIGGIFTYVSYRMSEQDHKLTSMVQLVSLLSHDLQTVKMSARAEETHGLSNPLKDNNIQYASDIMVDNLNEDVINVSDGESDSEYEDDEVEDEDEDEEDNVEDDDEDDVEEIDIEDAPKINVLKLNSENVVIDDSDSDSDVDDLENLDNQAENLEAENLEVENLEAENLEVENLEVENLEVENLEVENLEAEPKIENLDIKAENLGELPKENMSFLKNIDVIDIGEVDSKSDYKKMSINKLREVVVSKGLIADASKLKKQDVLKLLGDE